MKKTLSIQILLLIFVITIINFFDKTAISYAILPIQSDLHLDNAQFGYIASGWGLGYMLMVFFDGMILDRFGSIKTWSLFVILWSIITICMSQVSSFALFFTFRLLLGIAEGIHFPALTKTVADWMPSRWRSLCLGLSLFGVPFSSVIGAPFITFLIQYFGWRSAFIILGSLGILWSILWLWNFKGQKNPHHSSVELGVSTHKNVYKALFTTAAIWINCVIYFIFGYTIFFGLIWLPGYLEKMHGISISRTGHLLMIPWLISSFCTFGAGWISDQLFNRTKSLRISRTYVIAAGMILSSLCFFLLPSTEKLEWVLFLFSFGLGFSFFSNPTICALAADLFPRSVGTSQAIHSFFFALAGAISPALTGFLVQMTGNFVSAIYCIASLALFAGLIAIFFHHPDRKIS